MLFHRLLWLGLMIMVLPACVPAYVISEDSRDNAQAEHTRFIVPGQTKMEDVLLQLGEPDGINVDQTKMYYRVSRDIVVMLIGQSRLAPLVQNHRYFKIFFDQQGVVVKTKTSDDIDWIF